MQSILCIDGQFFSKCYSLFFTFEFDTAEKMFNRHRGITCGPMSSIPERKTDFLNTNEHTNIVGISIAVENPSLSRRIRDDFQ
jgi:hypothetical protein